MALALLAALSACGGDSGDGDGVASVEDRDDASEAGAGGDVPAREAEPAAVDDAFVEFAACLRDEGLDEPAAEAEDGTFYDPDPEMEAKYPGYEAAYETCIPIVEAVTGSMELTPEEIAMSQDHALARAECMRARGHDFPDPKFGEDGEQLPEDLEIPGLTIEQAVEELNACADEVRDEHPGPFDE